jgi:hypothetical protein
MLIVACVVFGGLSLSSGRAQVPPPKTFQDTKSRAWWNKCLLEHDQLGRGRATSGEVCRRIKGRIAAKHTR